MSNIIYQFAESDQVQFISYKDLQQWKKQENAPLLIDVRDKENHEKFNVGGINVPITEFGSYINELDPDFPIVMYCQVGQKSFNAASLLIKADFTSVFSLRGGIEASKIIGKIL